MQVPQTVIRFMEKHHVMSVSVCDNGVPWCATCWYVFDAERMCLIFVSDSKTRHGRSFERSNQIAGTISNNEKRISRIRGIQFEGTVLRAKGNMKKEAKRLFLQKFPLSVFIELTFWIITINTVKMTDNTLFFSSKTYWERDI
jgi:uncharacterized protein